MKNIILTLGMALVGFVLVACSSSGSNTSKNNANIKQSKSKVSVLTAPKALAVEPSGHTTITVAALSPDEKQSWFSQAVTRTWQRECSSPKVKEFPRQEQGVLSFVGGTNGIWGIQCSNNDNYFALMPVDPNDKLQLVSCEGEIAQANLCRKF